MKGYTNKDYNDLTVKERLVVDAVQDLLHGYALPAHPDDETLEECFELLAPCEGCVPDGYCEDLHGAIRKKYAAIYSTASELATKALERKKLKRFHNFDLRVLIDVDYEDHTRVAVVDTAEGKPYCYHFASCKPWHFHFESLKDLAREVAQVRDAILTSYARLNKEDA